VAESREGAAALWRSRTINQSLSQRPLGEGGRAEQGREGAGAVPRRPRRLGQTPAQALASSKHVAIANPS